MLRVMLEGQVVHYEAGWHAGRERAEAVSRKKEIDFILPQHGRDAPLKPQVEEHRVARRGVNHNRIYIGAEYKSSIIGPVEKEDELMLGMCPHNTLQHLMRVPANALEPPFQQQP